MKTKKIKVSSLFFCFVISMVIVALVCLLTNGEKVVEPRKLGYQEFVKMVDDGGVAKIYYEDGIDYVPLVLADESEAMVTNPGYDDFKKDMLLKGVEVASYKEYPGYVDESKGSGSSTLFQILAIASLCFLVPTIFVRSALKNSSSFGVGTLSGMEVESFETDEGDERGVTQSKKTFADVCGLKESKKDLATIVDFLHRPGKYEMAGAKLPKGCLFYGPPGTGKTLLAKAIAGEAGVSFFYASGSDFVEMYVGVGAKRVREMFKIAKENAPCIVFIDEIDALGGKRDANRNNEERRSTLNAFLAEMDGFKESSGVMVIGATNDIDSLDNALLRPGRFTNKYCIPLPETSEERLEILQHYGKNKYFDETVDMKAISKELVGFSPAQIESLLNEAAIIQVSENHPSISKKIIDKAMMKMIVEGHIREDQSGRSREELETVAWHEAGHALVGKLKGKEITKVTILSTTSGAGGVTFSTPKKEHLLSKEDLVDEVMELYAGRVGELALFGTEDKVTTGASNDFERASDIVEKIVEKWGMSKEFGPFVIKRSYSDVENEELLRMKVELAKSIYEDTKNLVKKNFDKLEEIAELLLKKETIYAKDLDKLF